VQQMRERAVEPPDYLSRMIEQNYQMRCAVDHTSGSVDYTCRAIEQAITRLNEPQLQSQAMGPSRPTYWDNFLGSSGVTSALTKNNAPDDSAVRIPFLGHVLAVKEPVAQTHTEIAAALSSFPYTGPSKMTQSADSGVIVRMGDDYRVQSQGTKRDQPIRRKNFWTIEEDKMLLKFVQKYGHYGYW